MLKLHAVTFALVAGTVLAGCGLPSSLAEVASDASAQAAGATRWVARAERVEPAAWSAMAARHGLKVVRVLGALGIAVLEKGAGVPDAAGLAREKGVQSVEREPIGRVSGTPHRRAGVPEGGQWDLVRMQVREAWDIRPGSDQAIVAVVDTGVDLVHPDLASKLEAGLNAVAPAQSAQDDQGHGTAVAGSAVAVPGAADGLWGVAKSARLMPIKANQPGSSTFRLADVAAGLVWAVDHGANAVALAPTFAGSEAELAPLREAVRYAVGHGVLVVSGAPEAGQGLFPAAWAGSPGFENTLAVAAIDRQDRRSATAASGAWLSAVAPGVDVPVLVPGGYGTMSGSALAAGRVAGLAALLTTPSRPPSLKTLCAWMLGTAGDLGAPGRDPEFGAGCVNALRAIQASTR